jgi:hypothetical protein
MGSWIRSYLDCSSQYAPIKHFSCQNFLAGKMANVQMMNQVKLTAVWLAAVPISTIFGMGIKSNTVVYGAHHLFSISDDCAVFT